MLIKCLNTVLYRVFQGWLDNDGIWDIIAYDTDEDGSYERVTSFRWKKYFY